MMKELLFTIINVKNYKRKDILNKIKEIIHEEKYFGHV